MPEGRTVSIRLINLLEDQPQVSLCVGGAKVSAPVGYGEVTIHESKLPAEVEVSLTADGTCTDELATSDALASDWTLWSAVAAGSTSHGTGQLFLHRDDFSAPEPGMVRSRAVHSDPEAGPIDLGRIFPDGNAVTLFEGLVFGHVATGSALSDFDTETGYATLPPAIGQDVSFGAFRTGTDHQIVNIVGPQFGPDRVYSVYPAGSVISGEPPAQVFVCDDTEASTELAATCQLYDAEVVGDPTI